MSTLDLPDIQGIIVRGYRMPMVRYFLLKVETPAAARALLGRLTTGDESDGPQITTADEWHVATPGPDDDPTSSPKRKPDYCLNVGITWPGLVALGVHDRLPPIPPGSFDAFVEGAAKRAARVGDHGDSGPEHWVGGFGTGNDHVMMALYALSPESMDTYSRRLTELFEEGDAFEELWHVDGALMTEMVDGKPTPVPGSTSATPMASPRRRGSAAVRNRCRPIIRNPASRGSSFSRRTQTTTTCPVRRSSGAMGASGSSRWSSRTLSASRTSCNRTRTASIPNCSPPSFSAAGATAFPWRFPRTRIPLPGASRRKN